MNQTVKRGLALLMALVMCIGLMPALYLGADAATQVTYEKGTASYKGDTFTNVVYNWGTREETATFLSPMAESFYQDNNVTYELLSSKSGATSTSQVPSSELYKALQNLMKNAHTKITDYDETRPLYAFTDCEKNATVTTAISSFYSGDPIGPAWDEGDTWNREHTWPNSKGDASGQGENDIMMLRPAAKSENGSRGNTAYGESSGYYFPNTESGGTVTTNGAHDVRGDVARTMLYVYVRWGNTGKMWGSSGVIESRNVLLKWMAQDPVDTWEMGRNDSVQSVTGTRNVFVDYPELAFLLFGEQVPTNMVSPSNGDGVKGTFTPTNPDDSGTAVPPASGEPTIVTEVQAGTAYKLGLYSTNKSSAYYFTGTMSGYYGATDTSFDNGVDVYAETATGGYYLYFNSGSTKNYINLEISGTHYNFTYSTTASSVFTWDADKDAMCTTVDSETCYMGTYGTYVTMGVLTSSKMTDADYVARFYVVETTGGGSEGGNSGSGEGNDQPGGSTTPTTPTVADGKYVLWSLSDKQAITALDSGKTYGYLTGTAVTLNANVLSGYTSNNLFTITNNGDGTFKLFDANGKLVYMSGTYNSFNVTTDAASITEGADWTLVDAVVQDN